MNPSLPPPGIPAETASPPTAASQVQVVNPNGLHLRCAAEIIRVVRAFAAEITLEHSGVKADARSIIGLLGLQALSGAVVSVNASGADAAQALTALEQLFATGFGEVSTEALAGENPQPGPA